MPPRGSEGLNFSPLVQHLVFLFTFIVSFAGWWTAFIGQVITTKNFGTIGGGVGVLWFAIFLELFLIIGVAYTLATDTIGMHRMQISAFTAVALVFSVQGATVGLFAKTKEQNAMGAGWMLLTIPNILWLLFFTSEEDSLVFHVFSIVGGGSAGLTPPSRSRRRNPSIHAGSTQVRQSTMSNSAGIGNGGYTSGVGSYGNPNSTYSGGGIGYDAAKTEDLGMTAGSRSQASFGPSGTDKQSVKSGAGTGQDAASARSAAAHSPRTPLIVPGGVGNTNSIGEIPGPTLAPPPEEQAYAYRAKALYACELVCSCCVRSDH
ncbi:Transmembrane osmosensor [Tulasnella sp. 418]|nr:Transmembrane osmosensor [Tulasnella sp. 418]